MSMRRESTLGRRPRLLFLCQTLPFPPDGGVSIRSFHTLRILAEYFDVRALCFFRRALRPTEAAVAESVRGLSVVGAVEAFPIPQEHSALRRLADHARTLLWRRPYTAYVYQSRRFAQRFAEVLASERPALVHVDSLDLIAHVAPLRGMVATCTHHNIESELLKRRGEAEQRSMRRWYVALQARQVRRVEREWCPRFPLNVAVSDRDAESLRAIAPGACVETVPNGVDLRYFQPRDGEHRGVAFVGGTTWYPNRDALAFFAREILPEVRRRAGAVPVWWIGRSTEDDRRQFGEACGIDLTGYLDDIRPHLGRAACYVVPLRVGGGTRLKILDAWAMGKAVVTTSVGCEGLRAVDGENALIRDDPSTFAEAVVSLIGDPARASRIGAAARATVERHYGWDAIGERLLGLYEGLLSRQETVDGA
jgi:glycosyltransferase involved in cell wall biosynthesis